MHDALENEFKKNFSVWIHEGCWKLSIATPVVDLVVLSSGDC
jgi:hypothetical protein